MALLGDMLAAARSQAGGFQAWLTRLDPELAGRVEAAANGLGLSPTGYVRMALADFSRFASEEDWATLTSSIKRTDDPGLTCLAAMVDWRLNARTCAQHGTEDGAQLGAGNERAENRTA